jgi:alpha,alpha-trehalase
MSAIAPIRPRGAGGRALAGRGRVLLGVDHARNRRVDPDAADAYSVASERVTLASRRYPDVTELRRVRVAVAGGDPGAGLDAGPILVAVDANPTAGDAGWRRYHGPARVLQLPHRRAGLPDGSVLFPRRGGAAPTGCRPCWCGPGGRVGGRGFGGGRFATVWARAPGAGGVCRMCGLALGSQSSCDREDPASEENTRHIVRVGTAVSGLPIAGYALLSDCRSAALVSRGGSIDWLCSPRFDGPSVFGRLLDDRAGHWSIAPTVGTRFEATRLYVDETLVLETTFTTAGGSVTLIDAMAVGRGERGHQLGASAVSTVLRRVVGVAGSVDLELVYAPRPEYGLVSPLLQLTDGGVTARGGADVLALSSPVPLETDEFTARASFTVRSGQALSFALHHRSTSEERPRLWAQTEIDDWLDDTAEAWRSWSALHHGYDGPWADLVRLSGRVLTGLTYFPTGAIVAAPTTSLPETPGGSRNWDYRYAWVRDASFTLQALWVAACPHEANKFFDYLAGTAASQVGQGGDLQIMFGIGGEHDLTERELGHLSGWRDSTPVRIGNGAWNQRQLDVYGELLDAAHRLPEQLDRVGPFTRRFLADLADTAASRWQEEDQGIWEIRGEPRQYVYSKLMCWVALDRAIVLADRLDVLDRVDRWKTTRDEIAEAIMTRGWNEDVGAFTQSFGSDELDASNLMMAIVGFIAADHPRMRATIDITAEQLSDQHGLVYRYLAADGLEGDEGTFLLCTFWLAHAQALAGQLDRARASFEAAAAFVNDVGLLSEEVDAATGELLGNFPQAFSHIGLVNAAWAIGEAEHRERDT